MNHVALYFFATPMVAGATSLFLSTARHRVWLARATALVMTTLTVPLLLSSLTGEITRLTFGGWSAPFGIAFQVDRLSALFAALLSLVMVATFSTLQTRGESPKVRRAVPAALFLSTGLAGAFLTTDIFNLFVMFELVLVSSYLLLQASGSRARAVSAPYVTMNVFASLLFFLGAGLLYSAGGSLSLPHLAQSLAGVDSASKTIGLGLLTLAFATKAGVVPLMFWLPRTYPHLLGPMAALFAGLMTKLGVYALFRLTPLLEGTVFPQVILWGGALTAVLAVLAAQAQTRFRGLLSFHVASQVGFMLVGIGLATTAGLTGAVLYVGHHVMVKTALFLIVDAMQAPESASGSPASSPRAAGPAATSAVSPALLVGFLLAGFSLAGLPPLSGFLGKVAVFQPLVAGSHGVLVGLLLLASFFTLASVLKIWRAGVVESSAGGETANAGTRKLPVGAGLLVAASVLFAIAAGPIHRFAQDTSAQLLALDTAPGALETAGASDAPSSTRVAAREVTR